MYGYLDGVLYMAFGWTKEGKEVEIVQMVNIDGAIV